MISIAINRFLINFRECEMVIVSGAQGRSQRINGQSRPRCIAVEYLRRLQAGRGLLPAGGGANRQGA